MVRLQNVLFQTQAQCFLWKWQTASTSDSNLRWALFTNGIKQALLELELGFTCLQMPTRVGWKKNRKSKFVFSSITHPYCWKKQSDSCVPHAPFATLSLMIWWGGGGDFLFYFYSQSNFATITRPHWETNSARNHPHQRPSPWKITFTWDPSNKRSPSWLTTLLRD